MRAKLKSFKYETDFLSVRDFLSQTFSHYQTSINWRIERWEYAFHFVAPYLADWGIDPESQQPIDEAIRFMETLTGLWETQSGDIVGAVNIEHPDPLHSGFGEFFIQRHPDHAGLLPQMLDFAEEKLVDPGQKRLFIYIRPDDMPLRQLLDLRGFSAFPEQTETESQFTLSESSLPASPNLPVGFHIQSMAENNDLAKRSKAFGRGFNHPDPEDWPSTNTYAFLQKAPDYQKDQDIVVVAPNGEFASFCLVWYDAPNKVAVLEPVGTQPEFRQMGLAREAIYEAMRRVAAKEAERVIVGSSAQFYQKIGFVPTETLIRFAKFY